MSAEVVVVPPVPTDAAVPAPAAVVPAGDIATLSASYAVGPGWVPVKREHIMSRLAQAEWYAAHARPTAPAAAAAASEPAAAADAGADAGAESAPSAQVAGNKRRRGQNKARSAESVGLAAGLTSSAQFCRAIALGKTCRFGAGCRDLHDMSKYLASKDADLPGGCYVYRVRGACPSGVSCRWASSHTDMTTGAQLPCDMPAAQLPYQAEVNYMPGDVVHALRRQTYPFRVAPPMQGRRGGGGARPAGAAAPPPAKQARGTADESNSDTVAIPTAAEPSGEADAAVPEEGAGAVAAAAAASGERARDKWASAAYVETRLRPEEKKRVAFEGAVYIAPLTTVGNLPFRRVMVSQGADITCGEMALAHNIVGASFSELALLRRHPSERVFGVQVAGSMPDVMSRAAELIERHCEVDFVDINAACPIDLVNNSGMGASLMGKTGRLVECLRGMSRVLSCPLTIKLRTGLDLDPAARFAHKTIQKMRLWSLQASSAAVGYGYTDPRHAAPLWDAVTPLVQAVTVHGRTRQQRYTKTADWEYLTLCRAAAMAPVSLSAATLAADGWDVAKLRASGAPGLSVPSEGGDTLLLDAPTLPALQFIGNGDILTWREWHEHVRECGTVTNLVARGALVKPWLPREIKEQRDIDISSGERLDILREFVNYGLEHWGSDQTGVNHTRRYLLEWLSFLHRYVPVGVLEGGLQRMGDRPPAFFGRNDLETLMASPRVDDWITISEMLLGPVPADFRFVPKHKSNSYASLDVAAVLAAGATAAAAAAQGGSSAVAAGEVEAAAGAAAIATAPARDGLAAPLPENDDDTNSVEG